MKRVAQTHLPPDTLKLLRTAKLKYVTDALPGITRIIEDGKHRFVDHTGAEVIAEETLDRIKRLVIPPAWKSVWICKDEDGHLQATGIDQKARKQYRYHPLWNKFSNEKKYTRLHEFGTVLPRLRNRIKADLRKNQPGLEKVIAIALQIMQKTLIRVGNSVYADLYKSYGLTTLKNRHVQIKGEKITFHFRGKKGVVHDIELKDPRMSRLLKKVKDLPGQELFQYINHDGEKRSLDSGHVNAYIHEATGGDFTAKDFRTWSGTVHMLDLLAEESPVASASQHKKNIVKLLDQVAAHLGNTRTVCKKYYVHPELIIAYENDKIRHYLDKLRKMRALPLSGELNASEKVLMIFLKDLTFSAATKRR